MLELNRSLFLGEGGDKRCYRHPADGSRCVKVLGDKEGALKRVLREVQAHEHLKKRGLRPSYLSFYLGQEETNLGTGYVFEYVDPVPNALEVMSPIELRKTIDDLLEECLRDAVVLDDMHLDNLIMDRSGVVRIIDGLGCGDFLPFCYWSRYLARRKVRRKFQGLYDRISRVTDGWARPVAG